MSVKFTVVYTKGMKKKLHNLLSVEFTVACLLSFQ